MKRAILEAVLAAQREHRPVALVTEIKTGRQALVEGDRVAGELALSPAQRAAVARRLRDDQGGSETGAEGALFVQPFNPAPRLIIVGAVHIAQPLAPMAALAGYAVTVVDPRRAFATDARFPDVALSDEWPDDALARLRPDGRTAVVTLTHDPKLDDPALAAALRSPAFYVGALGSTRTHAKRLERLRALGLSEAELARIHGPVGLDIGAVSPAEIAVAILGQITAVRHAKVAAAEAAA